MLLFSDAKSSTRFITSSALEEYVWTICQIFLALYSSGSALSCRGERIIQQLVLSSGALDKCWCVGVNAGRAQAHAFKTKPNRSYLSCSEILKPILILWGLTLDVIDAFRAISVFLKSPCWTLSMHSITRKKYVKIKVTFLLSCFLRLESLSQSYSVSSMYFPCFCFVFLVSTL